jgi:hypothetical protein
MAKQSLVLDSVTEHIVQETLKKSGRETLARDLGPGFLRADTEEIHYVIFALADEIKRLNKKVEEIISG